MLLLEAIVVTYYYLLLGSFTSVYNDQNAIPLPFIMQCCITSNDTTHILWTLNDDDTEKSHIFLFHRLCSHLKGIFISMYLKSLRQCTFKAFRKFRFVWISVCVCFYTHLFIIQDQQAEKTKSGSRAQLIDSISISCMQL